MNFSEFQPGVSFIYQNNPNEHGSVFMGIGEVMEIDPLYKSRIRVSWIWKDRDPNDTLIAIDTWYTESQMIYWRNYCDPINEREKFELLLKHNFS